MAWFETFCHSCHLKKDIGDSHCLALAVFHERMLGVLCLDIWWIAFATLESRAHYCWISTRVPIHDRTNTCSALLWNGSGLSIAFIAVLES